MRPTEKKCSRCVHQQVCRFWENWASFPLPEFNSLFVLRFKDKDAYQKLENGTADLFYDLIDTDLPVRCGEFLGVEK